MSRGKLNSHHGPFYVTTASDISGRLRRAHKNRELGEGRDLGQTEVAAELRPYLGRTPSQGSISAWFNGRYAPKLPEILGLARIYGVDPGWLAFGEDCRAEPPGWVKPATASGDGGADAHARRLLPHARKHRRSG